jgi:hypothetical protein
MREVLQRVRRVLDREDYETVETLFESYAHIVELVNQEGMTTARLYETLYGSGHERPECMTPAEIHQDVVMTTADQASIVDA